MPSIGYLDANSGSIVVAAVVAGFAGLAVFFRSIWQRIRHPFGGRDVDDTDTDTDADVDVDLGAESTDEPATSDGTLIEGDAPGDESVPSADQL